MHCRIWYSAPVVMAVVVWNWDESCVHCESYCSTLHPTFMMHGRTSLKYKPVECCYGKARMGSLCTVVEVKSNKVS